MHRLPCIFNDLQAYIVGPHGSVGRSHLRTVSGVHSLGVTGLMQALDLARKLSDKQDQKNYPCLAGIASEQATRVIVKYLRENPEKLQERAVTLSLVALQRPFPCK